MKYLLRGLPHGSKIFLQFPCEGTSEADALQNAAIQEPRMSNFSVVARLVEREPGFMELVYTDEHIARMERKEKS